MKLPVLFFVAVLLSALIQAQNQDVIGPGDILTVTLLNKWNGSVSRTVFVTAEGKIKPPVLEGTGLGEEIAVSGLRLSEAAQKLQQSYFGIEHRRGSFSSQATVESKRIVVGRGTTDQLLRR